MRCDATRDETPRDNSRDVRWRDRVKKEKEEGEEEEEEEEEERRGKKEKEGNDE